MRTNIQKSGHKEGESNTKELETESVTSEVKREMKSGLLKDDLLDLKVD